MAETSIEVAKADAADAERQVIGRLRLLFAEALGAAARVDLFERLQHASDQTVGVMNVRVRAGDASQLDSQLLQAQMNQVRAERLLADNQLAGLVLQIRALAKIIVQNAQTRPTAALQDTPRDALRRLPDRLAAAGNQWGIDFARRRMPP